MTERTPEASPPQRPTPTRGSALWLPATYVEATIDALHKAGPPEIAAAVAADAQRLAHPSIRLYRDAARRILYRRLYGRHRPREAFVRIPGDAYIRPDSDDDGVSILAWVHVYPSVLPATAPAFRYYVQHASPEPYFIVDRLSDQHIAEVGRTRARTIRDFLNNAGSRGPEYLTALQRRQEPAFEVALAAYVEWLTTRASHQQSSSEDSGV